MKRKVLALLLALVMALSLLPGAALAEEEEGKYRVEPTPCGGCTWEITSAGELRIYPTNHTSGVLANQTGSRLPSWYSYRTQITSVTVEAGTIAPASIHTLFYGLANADSIDLSGLDTSSVTDMSAMFYGCSSLTRLDVSGWDTSNVTDMSKMFSGCSSLTRLDVSRWDTSNVTDMMNMFYSCSSLASLDVSRFDTSSVTDMSYMFTLCSSLASLDVSNFDTSNVTDMMNMFYSCSSLASLDVSRWDTSSVTDMRYMFQNCSGLTNLDVSNFNISKVTTMYRMFSNCSSLASLDLSRWDTSNIKYTGAMFYNFNDQSYLLLPKGDIKVVPDTRQGSFTHVVYHVTSLQDSEGNELPLDVYAKKVFNAEPETPEGQDFLGWSTEEDASVATYKKGAAITYDSSVTQLDLYPVQQSHDWDEGRVTTAPTCTTTGERTYTCSVGGETRTESIPALGHDYDEGVVTKEPTCGQAGVKTFTCENDPSHTYTEPILATGNHTWGAGVVTKEPTYGAPGERTYTCSVCSQTKTEAIPALVYVPVPSYPSSPVTPSKPAEEDNWPFVDVDKGDDCYEAVKYVYDKGLMVGTSATTFDPYGPFTRAMVATVVFRMEDSPATAYRAIFTDVLAGQWHAEAITWGNDHAIVLGYGNGKFGPDDSVTVEQLLAILYRYAVSKDYDVTARGSLEGYVDSENISAYAVEAASWAVAKGLISGQGTLNPRLPATRAQVAEILMNFCLYVVK